MKSDDLAQVRRTLWEAADQMRANSTRRCRPLSTADPSSG